jgi:predicted Zn-ribbon and HTH transcriptional regulator
MLLSHESECRKCGNVVPDGDVSLDGVCLDCQAEEDTVLRTIPVGVCKVCGRYTPVKCLDSNGYCPDCDGRHITIQSYSGNTVHLD